MSSATALKPQRRAPAAGGLPPPRAAGLVPRTRLIRRLTEAHDLPLALLVAPAGYGKTTVLSEWAERDPRPFRWTRPDALAGLAKEVAATRHPCVLVLDDVHMLRDADSFRVLEEIVEAIPRGSQLALATRCELPLAVGRLRAHRRLVELRTADLAMGRSEAAALLERAGLRLDGEDLDTLVRRTEGWPAGLYLAALSLRAQPDVRAAVERFAGDDRLVADYLRDELMAQLSTGEISFLVRTSVLDTLSASACDAVFDGAGSGATLADLARSNMLLVSLDRSGESYRHHRLFAEMLRADLRRTEPDLEPELLGRASAWYAARGETGSAIRHAVAAGDVHAERTFCGPMRRAASPMEATTPCGAGSRSSPQSRSPPARRWRSSPRPAGSRPAIADRWSAGPEAARSLELTAGDGSRSLRAALTILRASGARDGLSRMGADAAGASRSEPDHSPWRTSGRWLEGVSNHLTGRREQARAPLEEGGRGGAAAAPNIQSLCLAQLTLLAIEDEDWDRAAVLIARARSQVRACGLERYPTLSLVFAVSGLVRAQRGMVEEAREDLHWSAKLLRDLADFAPWYEAETRIASARAHLRLGDVTAARTLMAEAAHTLRYTPDATTLRTWLEETRAGLDVAMRSAGESCSLTTAELRVLQLLPTHLSFPAIASRVYVSPNTVKTHARAVYRKLDASSRGEAVAHASAAGLLDEVQAA